MSTLKHIAIGLIIAEVAAVAVLLVGLMVPLPGKVEFKIVQSGSMEPEMPVGAVVAIVPAAKYSVGDVITFGTDDARRIPTTHRIVGVEREGGSVRYLTKGDANEEADNVRTAYGDVIGRVVFTVPRLGFVLDFARSEKGFLYMLVIPAGLIVLDELINIAMVVRERRRMVPDRVCVEVPVSAQHHQRGIRASNPGINGYRVILRPTYS